MLFRMVTCVFLVTCIFSSLAFSAEVWKITSLDWQPYADSKIPSQGTAVATLRKILKQAGINLIIEFFPWNRARKIAHEKSFVGYFPAWSEEVMPGFVPSSPIAWSGYGVMTYEGSGLKWDGLKKLFSYQVGLVSTYVYPANVRELANLYPENVDITPSELSLVRKLSKRRFEAAISSPEVMFYIAGKQKIKNLVLLKFLGKKELVIAFRDEPDNQERIILFERLLKQYFSSMEEYKGR